MAYNFNLQPTDVKRISTENRRISTKIPAPGTKEIFDNLERVESRSMHGQLPLVWDKAENFSVYDIAGNKWIDFTSTIFVANVGHSNLRVTNAIKNTLENPLYSCYAYSNPVRLKYIRKLIDFCGEPFEKAFLLSAGTEATEAAMKLMRMNAMKLNKRRRGIICIQNNWHGRTLGAQLMSGNSEQKSWVGFDDLDIHHIPFPYPWEMGGMTGSDFLKVGLSNLEGQGVSLSEDICGFMLETFQGWGAVFYPNDFVAEIANICQENQILLAFDEMQAGFGRTGKKFGFEHYGVKPDLICVGKGMGGGVPLSGVIGRSEIMDLPNVGNMSSTHSANPMVCAAGLAVLEELEGRNLVEETARKGKLLRSGLQSIMVEFPEVVSNVLGQGLIQAMIFKDSKVGVPDTTLPSKISELCMQKGLLVVHTGRESIKFGPPLTITDGALLEGIEVLRESIAELVKS